jgi:hypothetical protein
MEPGHGKRKYPVELQAKKSATIIIGLPLQAAQALSRKKGNVTSPVAGAGICKALSYSDLKNIWNWVIFHPIKNSSRPYQVSNRVRNDDTQKNLFYKRGRYSQG